VNKFNVEVIALYNLDGDITPLKIRVKTAETENVYNVNKPGKPVKGASLKIGVQGNRYPCFINGKRAFLYLDHENKWFVELV